MAPAPPVTRTWMHSLEPELPYSIIVMLRTNAVPSQSIALQIQELLAEHKKVLPLLEAEHASSAIPTSELRKFESRINDLQSLLSPARKLIPELVSTVFEFCVSTQGRLPTPCAHQAPLLLGQICSSWRDIALSTPKLWSSIRFHLDLRVVPRDIWFSVMRKQALLLKTWLERSGTVSLFIHIQYVGFNKWIREKKLVAMYKAISFLVSKLYPHQSHWKNIYLQLPFNSLYPLFGLRGITSPTLKSLTVLHIPLSPSDIWPSQPSPMYAAPSNTKVMTIKPTHAPRLRGLYLDIPASALHRFHLPWGHLVELTMTPGASLKSDARSPNDRLSLSDALKTLRNTPNLKRCTLAIGSDPAKLPDTPVVLPVLQKLSIYAKPDQFGAFLRLVVLPKLERFIIHKHRRQQELLSFLAALVHPIKELSFVRILDMSDEDLLNCLLHVPSLTHLHCSSAIGAQALQALTPSPPANNSQMACLCPELTLVEFRCWRPFNALVEMIDHRLHGDRRDEGVSQLKSVRLHLHSRPDYKEGAAENESQLMRRLQAFRDEGLDIKWQL